MFRDFEIVYSKGSAAYSEDGYFCQENSPFVGVFDAFSAPYSPSHPPHLFKGKSGGQVAGHWFQESFSQANPKDSLIEVLKVANDSIADFQAEQGINLSNAGKLAGVVFAIAKITEDKIEIIQAGDCFAFGRLRDGEIFVTKNYHYLHNRWLDEVFNLFLEGYGGNKDEVWDDFIKILECYRDMDINRPRLTSGEALQGIIYWDGNWQKDVISRNKFLERRYAVLNGQSQALQYLQRIELTRSEVQNIIFCTDGFVAANLDLGKEDILAATLLDMYDQVGLGGILREVRRVEDCIRLSHIQGGHAEATAIAIEF